MAKLQIESAVRLGEQLVREGLISPEQLTDALAKQRAHGGRIGGALLEDGAISAASLVGALSKRL